jgi:hypothetical protein
LKENVETTPKNLNVFQIVGMNEMGQRSGVLVPRLKGLSKKAIHHDFVGVLKENAASYSNATRSCREAILDLNSEEASSSPKDDGLDAVSEAILLALSDEIFSSVRQIARGICVATGTIYCRLVDSLHCTVRYLHWAPYKLCDSQKAS